MEVYKGQIFESEGILKYSFNSGYGYKLVVQIEDKDLSRYYRSLIPKWIRTNTQMYDTHITVVRKEVPVNLDKWEKYQGKRVGFLYSNYINSGTVYWWLNAFSKELETIRLELGLPVSSEYTLPPEGFVKCFHITIANMKNL